MTTAPMWTTEQRKLAQLIAWGGNPRSIEPEQAARLVESKDEFGQIETIAIGPGNEVYNGHQRLKVWAKQYGDDHLIDVRVASRELTEQERKKLTVFLHRGATGDWDWEKLLEWDPVELLDWGFTGDELGIDADDLLSGLSDEDAYTQKIQSPVYEMTGEKPAIAELYDRSKTDQLLSEIDDSEIDDPDIVEFLKMGAMRHIAFYFENIAEFYAHSSPEVQLMIEHSAMVIIDFDQAIEQGYVNLTNEIRRLKLDAE